MITVSGRWKKCSPSADVHLKTGGISVAIVSMEAHDVKPAAAAT
jgi:hypothetical protein